MASSVSGSSFLDQSWVVFNESSVDSQINPPKAAILYSDLFFLKKCETASGHSVYKMEIRNSSGNQVVYYKQCSETYPSHMAQIEAALSASYRLVRGHRAAKVRPVIDVNGKVVGSVSYEIEGFQSFDNRKITAAEMIKMGVFEELVARYVRKEDDLHPGNIGTSGKGEIVGIDFDMSFYDVTSKIKGPRVINGLISPAPADSFPITDEDITKFPNTKDSKPCFWPTKMPNNYNLKKRFLGRAEFINLSGNPNFDPYKYYAFLKEILFDPEMHFKVMEPYFSDRDKDAQKYFSEIKESMKKDWLELEERLVENADFRKFILNNKRAVQYSVEYCKKYNEEVAEYGFKIDLNEINEKYLSIVKKCMIKDLANTVYDLGYDLKNNLEDWKKFGSRYNSLIDCFIIFQKSREPFLKVFLKMEFDFMGIVPNSNDTLDPWTNFCKNVSIVIDNYRGFLTKTHDIGVKATHLRHSVDNAKVSDKKSMDVEGCLARVLRLFLTNNKNREKVVNIARESLEMYKPYLNGTTISGLNPFNYSRSRVSEIEKMIRNLQNSKTLDFPHYVNEFIKEGRWNVSLVTRHSANVLLISKLCQAALDVFRRRISFIQLKEHDLVEIGYALQRGDCSLENLAEKIALKFFEIINRGSENLTDSLNL